MKAVVVEIRGKYVAALTNDGCVIRLLNKGYEIGQEVELNKMKKFTRKTIMRIASVAAVVVLLSIGAWAQFSPYSYVSLDVNPSVEYTLNRFDKVLDVNAVNDDGEEILTDLDLKNKTIDEAVKETVEEIAGSEFVDEDGEIGLVITTSSDDPEKAEELAEELQDDAEEVVDESGIEADIEILSVGKERVLAARAIGVTPGKLNLVEKLKASSPDPDSIVVEEWVNRPVKDIMKTIKQNRKQGLVQQPEQDDEDTKQEDENEEESQQDNEELAQGIMTQTKQTTKTQTKQNTKAQNKQVPKGQIKQEAKDNSKQEPKGQVKQEIKPQNKQETKEQIKQETKAQKEQKVKQDTGNNSNKGNNNSQNSSSNNGSNGKGNKK